MRTHAPRRRTSHHPSSFLFTLTSMEGKDDIQLPKGQLDAILHAIAKSEENTGNKLNSVKNEMMESFGGKLEEVKLVAEDAKSTALKAVDQAELNRLEIEPD